MCWLHGKQVSYLSRAYTATTCLFLVYAANKLVMLGLHVEQVRHVGVAQPKPKLVLGLHGKQNSDLRSHGKQVSCVRVARSKRQ